ncbi:GNAT family N-acetyltransferase [Streptomyces sp. P38-E01]|uniref:GNAT family N-acetyltransferase n=1 Tax=Streptomyces tardus TaxID=2780544 RepID=A0A949JE96_9ACTN|nr:GNAT family N-acetyltransferase [Streptomyces tardus]MBU7598346.1 GNAT family N-acetyltransferase [Streptomyces tardus]
MTTVLSTPDIDGTARVLETLGAWQRDGDGVLLHPGDVGWFWRFGAQRTADALRVWRDGERLLAVGLLDGPDLLRATVAPELRQDEEFAVRMADDLADPERGALPAGPVYLEAPGDARLRKVLLERPGWHTDEPWTPFSRDLTEPVPEPGIRIEVVEEDGVGSRAAVQRAAFEKSTFDEERWRTMAAGPAYAHGRCLLGRDEQGAAVATVTVWSAGPGRPGVLEPMGVHRDHRGHGYGRAITLAAAAALRELGASSALVSTPSANVGGVATYRSAGFEALPPVPDLRRDA